MVTSAVVALYAAAGTVDFWALTWLPRKRHLWLPRNVTAFQSQSKLVECINIRASVCHVGVDRTGKETIEGMDLCKRLSVCVRPQKGR